LRSIFVGYKKQSVALASAIRQYHGLIFFELGQFQWQLIVGHNRIYHLPNEFTGKGSPQ